ncbi:unnamed protein product [Paramecium primaurelia]|uniref:WD40-repeat-containing domain n=1 Tax=Paramecium primaurelia TaxID=5886 RepID=A0A8S1Q4W3_PARPR|nr:unnamed protein product [Paramecium primaurelia]
MKFNSSNSFLFTGSDKKIKIYSFRKGLLYKIGESYHSDQALTYLNCNKDTILISGCNQMIKIRSLICINNSKVQRKIQVDQNSFSCFAISEKNNLLVAGLQKHIYFWEENGLCVLKLDLQLIDGFDWVYSLSFNESQNKIISCNGDHNITIIQQQNNQIQQWKIVQIINMDNFGTQAICFGDDSFVFHPWMSRTMFVYKFNQQNDQYTLSNTFLMQGEGQNCYSFISQYIKQKQLFIKQDKNELCLFQVNKNQELQIIQKVRFQEIYIWGTMSNDGLWLIVWDEAQKLLKVISCFKN